MNPTASVCRLRRLPVLLLVPCLLAVGLLAVTAPVRDAGTDSIGAHQQVMRAPVLRAPLAGYGTPALPAVGYTLPAADIRSIATESAAPAPARRPAVRVSPPSRAPPALL